MVIGLLAIAFIIIPVISSQLIVGIQDSQWRVPNYCLIFLVQTYIVTWFVSGYRLFNDGFQIASGDLLNSISDLSIQTDLDYKFINTNFQYRQYFNPSVTDIFGFITENSRLRRTEVDNLVNRLSKHSTDDHLEIELLDKDENERLFRIKMSDLFWRGKKNGYTFLLSDLTEIKNKEQELANINNTKDQIFSMIAHDLRKPALAFKGVTNKVNYLIQKKEFDLLKTLGNSIEKSAIQLNSLLDNLLKWALSQKDMITVNQQPVQIKYLIDELIKTFELITNEKGITIDDSGVEESLVIESDPDIIETILRNLIDNAIKYSESESSVIVETETTPENTIITVKDFGKGMTEGQVKTLFEMYKGKSTYGTHGEQGSGLGLNLVSDLVKKTGGVLTCESAPSKGTEMRIIIKK